MIKKLTNKEVSKALAEIKANLAFENMILTEEELRITEKILRFEISSEDAINYYLEKAGVKNE